MAEANIFRGVVGYRDTYDTEQNGRDTDSDGAGDAKWDSIRADHFRSFDAQPNQCCEFQDEGSRV